MLWLELQGLKCLNPLCPDSSDRSPSKLSSRHWQLGNAPITTSLSNYPHKRVQCTNVYHDNCCHSLDKKSPVPVNHGRPSKSWWQKGQSLTFCLCPYRMTMPFLLQPCNSYSGIGKWNLLGNRWATQTMDNCWEPSVNHDSSPVSNYFNCFNYCLEKD